MRKSPLSKDTGLVPVSKQNRAFSTRFEDHKGLIYTLAMRCYARLLGARITAMEFEDVYSEMCVSYTKAARGFDPSRGIGFGAYLGRACYNDFNKIAEKLELEQFGEKRSSPRVKRKPIEEMNEQEREEFEQECLAAAHKPKDVRKGSDNPFRHFGLGLISINEIIHEGGKGAYETIEVAEEASIEGLSTVEEKLEAKRVVSDIRNDSSLLPETRAYILFLMGAKLSKEGKERIRNKSASIKIELQRRYGTSINVIKL